MNTFWSLLDHTLSRGSLMLAAVVLARMLPTPSFSAYSYFQLTVSMLAAYAALGLGVTAARQFAEVGRPESAAEPLLGTLWALSLAVSAAAFLGVLCIPAGWLSAGLDIPRWLLASGVAATVLGVVPAGAIQGLEHYRRAALFSAATGSILLLTAGWAAVHQSSRVAMGALVAVALLQAGLQFALAGRLLGWRQMFAAFGLRPRAVRRIASFAAPMALVSIVAASGSWAVGRIILQGDGATHAFALYAIGLQWFALAMLLPGMISRVLLPPLVRALGSARGSARHLTRKAVALATGLAAAMAALASAISPWLMSVYGDNYDGQPRIIAAYMAAAVVTSPATALGLAIVVSDGQWAWLGITAAGLVVLLLVATSGTALGMQAWAGALAHAASGLVVGALAFSVCRRRQLV